MTDIIKQAFADLGYTPWPHQVETVEKVIAAFDAGKEYVFLDAPTGSGKSLLAMVVQRVMGIRAVIVTATNALVEQYHKDFPLVPMIIGANNYPCNLRNRLFKTTEAKADSCYKKSRFFYAKFEGNEPHDCAPENCPFVKSRQDKQDALTITNYPYYIIDQLFIATKEDSYGVTPHPSSYHVELGIFDEAHLINEQFSQHYVIHYSKSRGREFLADIRRLMDEPDSQLETAYEGVFEIINENIARGSIGMKNHMTFVNMLEKFYKKMMDIVETKKIFARDESRYDRLGEMYHKYHGLFCKIDDYKKYKYEVVIDVKKQEGSLSVQPVFIGETSKELLQAKNLFMSATLNFDFMVKTMALDPAKCELIQVEYTFNHDDKIIDFTRARQKINYANMYDQAIVDQLRIDLAEILAAHKDDNGVVITTSFKQAEVLGQILAPHHDVIVHKSEVTAREVIRQFKAATKPTVLISPSLFEGVDLPGEQSRFQVLPKAPYLSIGSKRMFYISRKHRGVYLQMSIKRMIQAFGRSSRAVGDQSVTYVLDKSCGTLFRSRHNTWRQQFKVVT